MQITYYDSRVGRNRIKPRDVWGFYAYVLGVASGIFVASLLS